MRDVGAVTPLSDPPVRADGRCAHPGCTKLRQPERSRKYARAEADTDPWCSTNCCRLFHGVRFASDRTGRVDEDWVVDERFVEVNT